MSETKKPRLDEVKPEAAKVEANITESRNRTSDRPTQEARSLSGAAAPLGKERKAPDADRLKEARPKAPEPKQETINLVEADRLVAARKGTREHSLYSALDQRAAEQGAFVDRQRAKEVVEAAQTAEVAINFLRSLNSGQKVESDRTFVFWTHGRGDEAKAWAQQNNGVTLEMTPGGMALQSTQQTLREKFGEEATRLAWEKISIDFANAAAGEIRIFGPKDKSMTYDGSNSGDAVRMLFGAEWATYLKNQQVHDVYADGPDGFSGYISGMLNEH